MTNRELDRFLRDLGRMDAAGLLGSAANEIRRVHEAGDAAADGHLRAWVEAFPIVGGPPLARMRAARARSGFEAARREFARAQARRGGAVEAFRRALREGSRSGRLRWSWAVRGYARDVVRFLDALDLQRRLPGAAPRGAGARERGWWPLRALQEAAAAPYRERLLPALEPLAAAAHAADRERAWEAARGAAVKEFRQHVAARDGLMAEARRLSKRTAVPLPAMPAEFAEQVAVLRRWLRETEWARLAAQSSAESARVRAALAHVSHRAETSVAEAARWLGSRDARCVINRED